MWLHSDITACDEISHAFSHCMWRCTVATWLFKVCTIIVFFGDNSFISCSMTRLFLSLSRVWLQDVLVCCTNHNNTTSRKALWRACTVRNTILNILLTILDGSTTYTEDFTGWQAQLVAGKLRYMLLFPLCRLEFKGLTPPITHAQFASMNFVQRLSSKRVRQIEIRPPGRGWARDYTNRFPLGIDRMPHPVGGAMGVTYIRRYVKGYTLILSNIHKTFLCFGLALLDSCTLTSTADFACLARYTANCSTALCVLLINVLMCMFHLQKIDQT